jgi:AAA+ ATPase superfamily predicted ATPase
MVRLTKETHLCHCLCATSDCLFIEDVYSNARLEGRAEYILVDDLGEEEAFKVYKEFGFEEKEKIWEYIGGKIGDMIKLFERKKRGYSEEEALKRMLKDEIAHLDGVLERIGTGRRRFYFEGEDIVIDIEIVKEILKRFKDREEISKGEIDPIYRNYLVFENILFYNPLEGTVRPQSRLLWRVIKEVMRNE